MSSQNQSPLKEFVPRKGFVVPEDETQYILCKPKLMPLKSVTLMKLEKMQRDAEEKLKKQKDENENDAH